MGPEPYRRTGVLATRRNAREPASRSYLPARAMRMAGAVGHAFKLDAVRVQKINRVVVFVIFARGIDDIDIVRFQERLKRVDVGAVAELERIVMQADVVFARTASPFRI